MNLRLRADAEYIVREAINTNIPDKAVTSALSQTQFPGRVLLLSVGKAAFPMARAALETLGGLPDRGIVISKYGHIPHPLPPFECFEAGHPVPDENRRGRRQRRRVDPSGERWRAHDSRFAAVPLYSQRHQRGRRQRHGCLPRTDRSASQLLRR